MSGDRRGDWEHGVDQSFVALNAAQRVMDKQLDELDLEYAAIDRILRGDSEKETDGLISRQHALENSLNEIKAELNAFKRLMYGDHAGGPGILKRLDMTDDKRSRKEKREGYFWAFITATVTGSLTVGSLLVLNWDRVEDFSRSIWVHMHPAPAAPVKPKRPKKKKKPIIVPESDEPSKPDTQE